MADTGSQNVEGSIDISMLKSTQKHCIKQAEAIAMFVAK